MTTSYKPVYGNGFCSQIEEFQKCFTGEWRLLWEREKKKEAEEIIFTKSKVGPNEKR